MADLEDLEDLLAIDVSNALNRLPFGAKEHSLRRINGWAIAHQPTGTYSIELVGTALGPDHWAQVSLAGKPIPSNDLRPDQVGILKVRVPVSSINSQFKHKEVTRIDLALTCGKKGSSKPIYQYEGKILLLPKSPYSYKLTEHRIEKTWTGKQDGFVWGAKSFIAGPRGRVRGEEPHVDGSASVNVPPKTRAIPSTFREQMFGGGYGRFYAGSQQVIGDKAGMTGRFKNWKREGQQVRVGVGYEKQVSRSVDAKLQCHSADNKLLKRLPFGTSFAKLHSGYQSFTLQVTSFTGKTFVLVPGRPARGELRVLVEEKPEFKRLVIDVLPPGRN